MPTPATVAALYVQPRGVYFDLPGVEPWGLPDYLAFTLMLSGEDTVELHELLEAVASGETPTPSGRALLGRVAGQVRRALEASDDRGTSTRRGAAGASTSE